jgi:hypothetical protein
MIGATLGPGQLSHLAAIILANLTPVIAPTRVSLQPGTPPANEGSARLWLGGSYRLGVETGVDPAGR